MYAKSLLFITATVLASFTEGAFPYYGKLIADSFGESAPNGLAGSIYAINESAFQVIGFNFDGKAKNTVFLLGTDKTYEEASADSTQDATALVASSDPLGESEDEKLLVHIPEGKLFTDIKYIAVYSRGAKAYLGGAEIPEDFEAPAPMNIGSFTGRSHDLASDKIIVQNDRTICIYGLTYDGKGPDAYFYVGQNDTVGAEPAPFGKIPNEKGNKDKILGAYNNKYITLRLPATLSATMFKWLSIYCLQFSVNFGEVIFPENLNVPPFIQQ